MPEFAVKSNYNINDYLVISPDELREMYLWDTPLESQGGKSMPDSTIKHYIKAATEQLEIFLALKFKKQVYEETLSFTAEDYWNWSYLRLTYPVVCPMMLEGFLNTTKQVTYPSDWLSSRKTSDGILYHRNLYIVPSGNTTALTQAQLFTGLLPNLTYLGLSRIPNYWTVQYTTGFDYLPNNLVEIIGKLAAINVLRLKSDNVITPGINSFSLSIDGLSQSKSAKGYDQRIKGYLDDLTQRLLPQAQVYYRGYLFGVA